MRELVLALCAVRCMDGTPPGRAADVRTARGAQGDTIILARPLTRGAMSLEEALARRRSVREFTDAPVEVDALGQLLWAAQGITSPSGYRTAPSAGALYPLELHVAMERGLYRYEARGHRLVRRDTKDRRPAIAAAANAQEAVREAPVVIVIAAVARRTAGKYGERAERYVHVEAGHAAQNVLLEATALGLGAVPVGAFDDDALGRALALPSGERALYIIPVGHARP